MISSRIDDTTAFIVAVDGQNDTAVTNANGVEINPYMGVFTHNEFIYTTGSSENDNIVKYSHDGTTFQKEAETVTGEQTVPGSIIFASDSKAYVTLTATGELLVVDPNDLSISNRIDLSPYALGEGDISPEPSSGVIRDGKLYLALGQIDSLLTWRCTAGASLLIIDVATDMVEKHIQDDRTCSSGLIEANPGLILDEIGDIYVTHAAGYGLYSDLPPAGVLRIKNGATDFDPDYFFSIADIAVPDVPGNAASYFYRNIYAGDGMAYGTLVIPGLSSNPPNFATDKTNMPYRLDLRNQTATQLDMPVTVPWSAGVVKYDDQIVFGMLTDNGTGLYRYDPASGTDTGDQQPHITTVGAPVFLLNY